MDNRIKVVTTSPRLNEKISIDLDEELENLYWYIKFNIPLDEATVNQENMTVTDTHGFIMDTQIFYHSNSNTIVILPLDTYMENVYYILKIGSDIKSKKGKKLRRDVHVLFKLKNDKISQFEILKSTVTPPKPVKRPDNYDEMMLKKHKGGVIKNVGMKEKLIKSLKKEPFVYGGIVYKDATKVVLPKKEKKYHTLKYMDFKVNPYISIIGLLLFGISFYFDIIILMIIAILLCIIGLFQILIQMNKEDAFYKIKYNRAAGLYNKGKYEKAYKRFMKIEYSPYIEDILLRLEKILELK